MHPYHHALSSQKKWGGTIEDYLAVHNWFDQSKSLLAHANHRALRHHKEVIALAIGKFGLLTGECKVSVQAIAEQHLDEDCRRIPKAHDWLQHLKLPEWLDTSNALQANSTQVIQRIATNRLFDPNQLIYLANWFDEPKTWTDGKAWMAIRYHAFGIFECEEKFGVTIQCGEQTIPTRYLAEQIVRGVLGKIPTAPDWLKCIQTQKWMIEARKPAMVLKDQE